MRDRLTHLFILLGIAWFGFVGWIYFDSQRTLRETEKILRQFQAEAEKEFVKANHQIGLVESRLATQREVEERYRSLLDQKDAETQRLAKALDSFQKTHRAQVDSLTRANMRLQQVIQNGSGVASPHPEDPVRTTYRYTDEHHRFLLEDPDIAVPGNETLTVDQNFRLTAVVLRQQDGPLKAQQVSLQEVVRDGDGWKSLANAKLIDAEFTYAPNPSQERDPAWWDPLFIVTAGSTFRKEAPLNLGAGALLLRYGEFGLGAVVYSDMATLSGTGLAPLLTWRPHLNDRPFNFGVAAGVGVGVDLSVRPYIGAFFVLY